jgi:hypothetical protein
MIIAKIVVGNMTIVDAVVMDNIVVDLFRKMREKIGF